MVNLGFSRHVLEYTPEPDSHPEDGGNTFLRNVGRNPQNDRNLDLNTVSVTGRAKSRNT